MLLSMTGFGAARHAAPGLAVAVELRAVNNRHLKVTVRGTDPYPALDAEVEKVIRRGVRRGTVVVHLTVTRAADVARRTIDVEAVRGYIAQLTDALPVEHLPQVLPGVLALPGVAGEADAATLPDGEWAVVEGVIERAVEELNAARRREGEALAAELLAYHADMAARLAAIRDVLPRVVSDYRGRLLERVRQAVADAGVAVEPDHLIREVALFADRTDVAEEVSRFGQHLGQFAEVATAGGDGTGRRLEFIAQELGREVNTLGSKAGDVAVTRQVFEIKGTLEKVREQLQNVE